MCGVIEPKRGVDSDAEATMVGRVGLETVDNSDMCERAGCARRPEDLRGVSVGTPETRVSALTSQRLVTPMIVAIRTQWVNA